MNHFTRIPASDLKGLAERSKKSARTRARMTEARKPTGPVQTDMVSFTVEGKPRGKGRPRFNRHSSHAYTPASTVAYERQIKSAARIAMENHQPMEGPVTVTVRAIFSIPKSWPKAKRVAASNGDLRPTTGSDADNVLKASMDACNRVLWNDDVQVVEATISKEYGERPHLHIIARPLFKPAQLGETDAPITSTSSSDALHHRPQDPTASQ